MKKLTLVLIAVVLTSLTLAPAQRPGIPGSMAGQIKGAEAKIAANPEGAMKDIQDNLGKYSSADLPKALYVLGRAEVGMAAKSQGAAKVKVLQDGALDLMRVATYFPYAPEAAPALLEAAKAMALTGDKTAALNLLDAVSTRYKDSDAAKKADAEKAKLE